MTTPNAAQWRSLDTDDERARARAWRARLVDELARPLAAREPLDPVRAFTAAFGVRADVVNVERVRAAYRNASTARRDAPGFVYVFRDRREQPHVVKVGRTRLDPWRRIVQWRAELAAPRDALVVLFAFATRRATLAETIAHELLAPVRLAPRYNRATSRRVIEYFFVERMGALHAFLDATTRHATWFDHASKAR